MVDAEMKDASPAERDAMYKNVRNLDPAFARQVLSMNHLVRQMGQSAPAQQGRRAASVAAADRRKVSTANPGRLGEVIGPTATARSDRTAPKNSPAKVVPAAGVERPLPPAASIGASPWSPDHSSGRASRISTQRYPPGGQNRPPTDTNPGDRLTSASVTAGGTSSRRLGESGRVTSPFGGRTAGIDSAAAVGNPASNLSLAEWHDELARLIARAETAAVHSRPGSDAAPEAEREYVEKQVYLRMLYLMNDQRARSIEPIYGIDAADQEFWQQMFWAIAGYFDRRTIPDPRKRATETIASLQKAVRDLQPQAELKLANAAFCHKITSYGNYETFDRNEFRPGRPVLLYVEVENFASERTADNRFRTLLKSTIEIMDPAGNVLQKIPFPATEDLCRNYRRDYFHSYEFSIPETRTIGFGPHKVRLTVQDEISGQLATYTLNFNVTGN